MPGNPRTLRVLVGTLPIEDGQTPPPVVGEVGHFPLIFCEVGTEAADSDATVSVVSARAEPVGDGSPRRGGLRWDGTVRNDPPHWATRLHGDGWSAFWLAPRPVLGEVRLRGTLAGDLAITTSSSVRGRVTRVRVVTETFTGPGRQRIPARQRLRDVDVSPIRFDRGLRTPEPGRAGRHAPVRADPCLTETGVLVDLDLDDVPPLPLRPALVPGALSAAGRDVWVADTRLPRLVRIRDGSAVTPVEWPGRILGTGEAGSRRLYADEEGCWITGADGVHRCDGTDTPAVRSVADGAVWRAAAVDGALAVQVNLDPGDPHARQVLRLVARSGSVLDVVMPDRGASSLAPYADGFVLLVHERWHAGITDHDPRCRLARLSRSGSYTEGPPRDDLDHSATVHASGILADDERLYRIRPDLTLDEGRALPGQVLGVSPAGRPWVLDRGPGRRVVELDAVDLRPVASTAVTAAPAQLAADGTAAVWMVAGGVLRWDPTDDAGAEPVEVAVMAGASRPDPGHSVGPLG